MILRALVVALLAVGLLAAAQVEAPANSAAVPPVEPLAEAPWYDAQADTWRQVALKPPTPPEPSADESAGMGDGTPLFAYAMYLLVGIAIVLLAIQLWRLRGGWGEFDAAPRTASAPATFAALPFALPVDDRDPEAALRAALAAGDFALAVVWLYALQLLRLDAVGAIRLTAGKTNRSYLREAGAAIPATAAPLQATVATFERSHFGHQPPLRAELEALLDRHRALIAALPAVETLR